MPRGPITNARADGRTIGELSRRSGVHIETIRYYEKIGMLPAPPRTPGGRRVYGPMETRTLTFIRRARELGFSLDEIRALLALGEPGTASCSDVCAVATCHLEAIRAKIADLKKLETLLSETVTRCSGEDVLECAVLDALYPSDFEAFTHVEPNPATDR
jgi:MerR family transcriptional regulator, mercuric resistance operon regulatory protein